MIHKDISFSTPEENILFDEVLLHLSEQGKGEEVLRFWESPVLFIVLGRTSVLDDDVRVAAALEEKIPVLRRSSGGGTVLQGRGCLNFSLILSKHNHPSLPDLRKSYHYILGKVTQALARLDVEAEFQPISDLALRVSQKKISGNAQRRARNFILHHGTILYDFDLSLMGKFLKMPQDVPEYRRGRPHPDFVTNIPVSAEAFQDALAKIFQAQKKENSLKDNEKKCLQEFLKTKTPVLDLKI